MARLWFFLTRRKPKSEPAPVGVPLSMVKKAPERVWCSHCNKWKKQEEMLPSQWCKSCYDKAVMESRQQRPPRVSN